MENNTQALELDPETTETLNNIARRQVRFFASMAWEAIVLSLYLVAVQVFCSWLTWESHSRAMTLAAMLLSFISVIVVPLLFRAVSIQMLAWSVFVLRGGASSIATEKVRPFSISYAFAIGLSSILVIFSVMVAGVNVVAHIVKDFPL